MLTRTPANPMVARPGQVGEDSPSGEWSADVVGASGVSCPPVCREPGTPSIDGNAGAGPEATATQDGAAYLGDDAGDDRLGRWTQRGAGQQVRLGSHVGPARVAVPPVRIQALQARAARGAVSEGADEDVLTFDAEGEHEAPGCQQPLGLGAAAIVAGNWEQLDGSRACGVVPVRGALELARRHGGHIDLLDLRNSGDTAGPADRVVGYGSFAVR